VQVGNGTQAVVEVHWNLQVLTSQFPIHQVLLRIILEVKTPVIPPSAELTRLPFVILLCRQVLLVIQLPNVWELPIILVLMADLLELQLPGNGIPVHVEEPTLALDHPTLPIHLRLELIPIM
jgi:hypothetical protein